MCNGTPDQCTDDKLGELLQSIGVPNVLTPAGIDHFYEKLCRKYNIRFTHAFNNRRNPSIVYGYLRDTHRPLREVPLTFKMWIDESCAVAT